MRPKAFIAHDAAGRVRLRVPSREHDTAWFEALKTALAAIEGVIAVEANPLTASLLILHDKRDSAAILQPALGRGLFELASPEPPRPPMPGSLRERVNKLDDSVRTATRGSLDLRSAAITGLLTIAAVQALRGKILPPAAILTWWAGTLAFTGQGRNPEHLL